MERPRFKIILKAIIIIIISAIALIIFSIVIWYKTLPANKIGVYDAKRSYNEIDGALYSTRWNCQEMCSRRIPKIMDRQISCSVMRELLGSS